MLLGDYDCLLNSVSRVCRENHYVRVLCTLKIKLRGAGARVLRENKNSLVAM